LVDFSRTTGKANKIELFSMQGALIHSIDNPSITEKIPMHSLSYGVYFIRIQTNGGEVITRKLVKS
jgi:hypothetical protein